MITKFDSALDANRLFAVLADDFPFLPSQILASAFSAFRGSFRVSYSTFSADFHVEPMLLSKRLLEGIHYRQIVILR
jgi:molybdopterin-guanine dinucleotide biosynthesis protein A